MLQRLKIWVVPICLVLGATAVSSAQDRKPLSEALSKLALKEDNSYREETQSQRQQAGYNKKTCGVCVIDDADNTVSEVICGEAFVKAKGRGWCSSPGKGRKLYTHVPPSQRPDYRPKKPSAKQSGSSVTKPRVRKTKASGSRPATDGSIRRPAKVPVKNKQSTSSHSKIARNPSCGVCVVDPADNTSYEGLCGNQFQMAKARGWCTN